MSSVKRLLANAKNKIKHLPAHIVTQFKEEFAGETWQSLLKNNLYIIMGAIVYSIGASFFTVPMNVISGGLASISIILEAQLGGLSVDTYILILNWIVFALSLFVLGIKYSLKTLVFTLFNPLFIMFFTFVAKNACLNIGGEAIYIFDITKLRDIVIDADMGLQLSAESLEPIAYFLSACLGGAIMGCGIGLTLIGGGSSGGTDIINVSAHKYLHVKVGTSSLCCDVIIMTAGFFFSNDCNFLATLVGVCGSVLCSVMIDIVFSSKDRSYMALIVSSRWVELNDAINQTVGRGTTLIKGQGGYSRLDTMVVEVCFDRRDYTLLERTVHRIDPQAFMTVMKAQEIVGYGFSSSRKKGSPVPQEEVDRLILRSIHEQWKESSKDEK